METELVISPEPNSPGKKTEGNNEGVEEEAIEIQATSQNDNSITVDVGHIEVEMKPTVIDGANGEVFDKTETASEEHLLTTCEKLLVCGNCKEELIGSVRLYWETEVFCSSECIEQYEDAVIGKLCCHCKKAIKQEFWQLNVVRIGNKALTFCSTKCKADYSIEHYFCEHCKIEITPEAKLANLSPVNFGTKVRGENRVKHFCSHKCYEDYKIKTGRNLGSKVRIARCQGCLNYREVKTELTVFELNQPVINYFFCSSECMEGTLKAKGMVDVRKCPVCPTFVGNDRFASVSFYICSPDSIDVFCSERCKGLYFIKKGLIKEAVICRCKGVIKCSVDMILRSGGGVEAGRLYFCTVNCLRVYENGLGTQ